jgi:hypothetical protein
VHLNLLIDLHEHPTNHHRIHLCCIVYIANLSAVVFTCISVRTPSRTFGCLLKTVTIMDLHVSQLIPPFLCNVTWRKLSMLATSLTFCTLTARRVLSSLTSVVYAPLVKPDGPGQQVS